MKTILFDIDGTLLVTHSGGAATLRQAMYHGFGIESPNIGIQFGGRTDRSILTELLLLNGLVDNQSNRDRLRAHYVRLFPETLNQVGGELMPGVLPLMKEVASDQSLRPYVMTGNFHETGQHKLQHFELSGFFRGIFGGDHDSCRNELAKRTATELVSRYGSAAADDLIVVGDTVADIRCGHAIGAKVIAVCTGGQTREQLESESPLTVQDDLTNLPEIMRWLTQ
ncbi:HAD family hydrolase [Rubripirellula reticaptiva]|uniref:phosphoglycolate phosphatase n=1 Tax=Rubripirellula reticaptiva TaxID=2528013 RepID=A0A5C6EXK9_9BACT|nr:HAD family hydrolase [Rubripirellula reticaptiva]TWU51951.1 Phosphoglycolate phosphatase [Rubripirellula reticaptiva]